ncbi:peptidase domain-containing ABC transporter [Candidatus Cardinium sp. TP]|uniref:peptidase domain-containing ABC transporter n=1 Tax=Candidatus Cardinium sp. TP TaxID=2961955 RepID=UPI0021AF94CE|nr:type I secretion system permease/ATPase [Candidatus Cardinium sp. TP]MCT4697509.1 type I secretion system permease/ATPase [Candidatus Cardinium sp. TP]
MIETVRTALACSKFLLQLVGIKVTEDTANQASENTDSDFSQDINASLAALNRTYNAKLHQKKLSYAKLTTQFLPLAFLSTDGTYYVLAKIDEDQVLVQHPFKPRPDMWSQEQLSSCWTRKVIILSNKVLKFSLSWFVPAFWQYRHILSEILLFSLVLQVLGLVLPLFFQVIMDKVLAYKVQSTLDVLIFALVLTGIFEVLLRGLREYQYNHTAKRIDILLGVKLVKHLLGLPLIYFKNRSVGALVARVHELDSIRDFLSSSLFTLLVDVSFMSIFLLVMWLISPTLTLISLLAVPFYALVAWYFTKPLQAKLQTQFRYSAANTSFLTETIAGAETVKSLAIEPYLSRRWESQTCDLVDANYQTQLLSSLSDHLVQAISKVTSAFILWCGASMVIKLDITLGQLIAFNMLSGHFAHPLTKLVELWGKFVQAKIAIEILGDTLNLPVEQPSQAEPFPLQGAITLKQVTFRYQTKTPLVLQGISLHISAGEQIGIVGESGSGKSTLARLLLRLFLPEQGQILFDGVSLNNLNARHLRKQVAVVLQENYLFNRTVRDNIALSFPASDSETIIEASKLAGAHEFILQLPLGYDTVIAEGGSSLSGGQRQRIAIARALLMDPKILIFDEATSALDDASQALIQANMAKIAHGRTIITIAHRLSTVQRCDRIIVLQQGNIIEQGSHQALLQLKGKYAYLWGLQEEFGVAS